MMAILPGAYARTGTICTDLIERRPMIQPSDQQPAWPRLVSTTAGGPVTCSLCGCRLTVADTKTETWTHFSPLGGRDARGCRVACIDLPHDSSGRALLGVPA